MKMSRVFLLSDGGHSGRLAATRRRARAFCSLDLLRAFDVFELCAPTVDSSLFASICAPSLVLEQLQKPSSAGCDPNAALFGFCTPLVCCNSRQVASAAAAAAGRGGGACK